MQSKNPRQWFIVFFAFCIPIIILLLDAQTTMSTHAHQLVLVGVIILFMIAGSMFIYLRAKSTGSKWWQDDDWTNWGGI